MNTVRSNYGKKYGDVRRSTIRDLFFFMLAFGFIVGTIFPFFARFVLKTEKALSIQFIMMCLVAGLLVGLANFMIFRFIVSRELRRVQQGMEHVNESIASANVMDGSCENQCQLDITSADIIGDITLAFNNMTQEIFSRLEMEGETSALNESLIKNVELVDVAKTILGKLCAIVGAKGGLLYGGSLERMDLLANYGIDQSDHLKQIIKEEFGPVNQVLSNGKIHRCVNHNDWNWVSQSTPLGTFIPKSVLLLPLMTKQRPVGLAVMACESEHMSENQMKKLETLRTIAAPHLDNSMLHQKITELAAVDELTNLLNRRFGVRRLSEEFSRAARHGTPLSVVMMDIDHFKSFNDTYGHNAGDEVLRTVASILSANMRSEDMVCRYGGEEFLMLLSGAGLNDGAVIAERIRRIVASEEIRWGNSKLSISISLGVATYPIVRASVCEELITYADKALYAAKESGRNKVVVFDGNKAIQFSDLELTEKTKIRREDRE